MENLQGFLTYGYAKGVFIKPHTVYELTGWREFGDLLWEATLDDSKTAKKLSKLWRVAHNELIPEAENNLAEAIARERRTAWAELARKAIEKENDEVINKRRRKADYRL